MTLTNPLPLAQQLMRCPSITPREAGCFALLRQWFDQLGFTSDVISFGDGDARVDNFFAHAGGGDHPKLLLSGHIDVVPTGDETLWTYPPFSATVADGYLWGRGACDMKSSLAAMVAAVARHKQTYGKNPPLAFAATSDEEGIAINGTAKLLPHLAARGHTFGFCINGEPTSNRVVGDTVKVGRRGSFSATLHVQGRQGHVAYPQLAQNPVPVLLNLLQALRHLPLDKPFAQFPPTHLEITSIDVGNPARNVIPATASANVNIRYNPAYTHDELTEMIQAMLARIADKNIFSLHVVTPPTPAFITQNTPLLEKMIATIARTAGVTPALSTDGGTSDARFIQAFCPVIDCGPTNATIHQTNERIALTDLEKITEIYAAMIDVFTRH